MGWGSSGTPPWVDEKRIDEEEKEHKSMQDAAKIKDLEKENQALKKKIRELEEKLEKLKKETSI